MRLFKQRFLTFGYNGIAVRNNMNIDIRSKRYQLFRQGRFADKASLTDNASANHYFCDARKPRILGNLKGTSSPHAVTIVAPHFSAK